MKKTEERYQIEIDYWKQKAKQRFRKAAVNKADFLVMRKNRDDLQQIIDSLTPPEIITDTDTDIEPIESRWSILDIRK